jgi:hypothetical protein
VPIGVAFAPIPDLPAYAREQGGSTDGGQTHRNSASANRLIQLASASGAIFLISGAPIKTGKE